jgi:hypothetical protein
MLTYEWDPDRADVSRAQASPMGRDQSGKSFDLGPHPADPQAFAFPQANGHQDQGPNAQIQHVRGQELWVYAGNGGCVEYTFCVIHSCVSDAHATSTYTFWRFMIRIPLEQNAMKIQYSINNGQDLEFHVPAIGQNMRWAAYSVSRVSILRDTVAKGCSSVQRLQLWCQPR